MPKEIEPIFSQGGYSIWKTESEGQSDPKRSEELKNPFFVTNFLGTKVRVFENEEDARNFLNYKIEQNKFIGDLLSKAVSFSQVSISLGLFLSLLVGYLIPFFYFNNFNETWMIPEIINESMVKLFILGFIVSIFIFYIPFFFGYLIELLFRIGDQNSSTTNDNRNLLSKFLNRKCYICYNILSTIIIFALTWLIFEQIINVGIHDNICKFLLVALIYLVLLGFLVHIGFSFSRKTESSDYYTPFNQFLNIFIVLLIPILLIVFTGLTNFSKIVFRITGMGANEVSIKLLNEKENSSHSNSELQSIATELKTSSNGKKEFCIFAQTNKELFIVDNRNKKNFCSDPSFSGPVGNLIRIPKKYVISIGESSTKDQSIGAAAPPPPSPSPSPAIGPR